MENEEIKAYHDRIKNELDEYLSYEKLILRQIEINKQGLRDDEKIRKITELEKKLTELNQRQAEIKPSQIRQQVDEIMAYKDRLAKTLNEMLEWQEGIKKQTEIETQAFDKVKADKDKIIASITDKTEEDQKQFRQFRQDQTNLSKEIADFHTKQNDLEVKRRDIEYEKSIFLQKIKDIASAVVSTNEEKAGLAIKKAEYENKISLLETDFNEISAQKAEMDKSQDLINHKLANLDAKEKMFNDSLARVSLREEAVNKDKEQLEALKQDLEKEKQHFNSQQTSLQAAFKLARQQGII